jgi:sulfatase maturation enzyme AslB (radical SAM superfamily)
MKFSQLAFIVTDDCNFRCAYCSQRKQEIYMTTATIRKAADFFYPFLETDAYIVFYGGEPLLAFDAIRYATALIKEKEKKGKKNIRFSLTTNGSLVTDEMLAFFDSNRFELMLSFDGHAQETGRRAGSREPCERLIQQIQDKHFPNIQFSINSVFSPETVSDLSASLQSIIQTGVYETDIQFDLADNTPWDERSCAVFEEQLADLTRFLVSHYRKTGVIPLDSYKKAKTGTSDAGKTTFACAAGRNRMAITPAEELWGCYVFHTVFRDLEDHPDYQAYCFGKLDEFTGVYQWVYPRGMYYYDCLSQNYFCAGDTQCFFCDEVNSCRVCPAHAAISTSSVGNISPWVCRLNRIRKKEKIKFLREIEGKPSPGREENLINYGRI